MKMTINKSNYTGEYTEITINQSKKTVTFRKGETPLTLKFGKDGESVQVFWEDKKFPFCTGFKIESNLWYMSSGDYSRDHENPYAAAAQLAFNLI